MTQTTFVYLFKFKDNDGPRRPEQNDSPPAPPSGTSQYTTSLTNVSSKLYINKIRET